MAQGDNINRSNQNSVESSNSPRPDQLEAIVNNARGINMLLDSDGNIEFCSRSSEQLLGYSPEDMLHTSSFDYIEESDRSARLQLFHKVLEAPGQPATAKIRWKHKNGSIRTSECKMSNMLDEPGVNAIVCNCIDMTELVDNRSRLDDVSERFRLAAEAINAVIYDWNLVTGGCYESSGLFTMLGFDPAVNTEVQTNGWWNSRIHPDDFPNVLSVTTAALLESNQYELEYRMRHLDGHYVYVWDRGLVVRDEEGTAIRVVGSTQDITLRKQVEAQLIEERNRALTAKESAEEMTRLKTNFLTSMSHEIRTPMTAIVGFAEILAENLAGSSEARYANVIEANSKRLLQTINSILDLARVDAKKINLTPAPIDVNAEIEHLIHLLEPLASKKRLKLHFEPSITRADAIMDGGYLTQIVTNLLGNAIKFTETGSITVNVSISDVSALPKRPNYYHFRSAPPPSGEQICISIEDSGRGISKEKIGLIFEEFRQELSGYNRNHEGTGLGLTISSKVAAAMGGSIEVLSALGAGSIFLLRLPRYFDAGIEGQSGETELHRTAAKRTILLVEDIASMAEMTQIMIGNTATVLHASSTAEARHILTNITPDMILMDVGLGEEMTGLDFTRELRASSIAQKVKIVALTAFAMPKDRQAALDAGCDDYLAKPFSKAKLLEIIQNNFAVSVALA